jgi:hypothetical protein
MSSKKVYATGIGSILSCFFLIFIWIIAIESTIQLTVKEFNYGALIFFIFFILCFIPVSILQYKHISYCYYYLHSDELILCTPYKTLKPNGWPRKREIVIPLEQISSVTINSASYFQNNLDMINNTEIVTLVKQIRFKWWPLLMLEINNGEPIIYNMVCFSKSQRNALIEKLRKTEIHGKTELKRI